MIYYATYYSLKNSGRQKNYAGEDKVDYICHAMAEERYKITLLSSAKSGINKYLKKEKIDIDENITLQYFSSFANSNRIIHGIDVIWGYIQLVLYSLIHINRNDTVLVYHSLGYRGLWSFLKRIIGFRYVLEVEEIYQKFNAATSSYKKCENKVFKYPDAFIFSNSILGKKVNIFNKPYAIVNGVYKLNDILVKPDKNKLVYAGSLEEQKGVDYIIPIIDYLPTEYSLHIIGFGSDIDIARVKSLIGMCKGNVYFDGALKGKEYISFLQSCEIGLCIQDEADEFNKYEFPSKVFSYLSNGLKVVTNDLVQLRSSAVFPYLSIANGKNPKEIANAVLSCNENTVNSGVILSNLDRQFRKDIKVLIGECENDEQYSDRRCSL